VFGIRIWILPGHFHSYWKLGANNYESTGPEHCFFPIVKTAAVSKLLFVVQVLAEQGFGWLFFVVAVDTLDDDYFLLRLASFICLLGLFNDVICPGMCCGCCFQLLTSYSLLMAWLWLDVTGCCSWLYLTLHDCSRLKGAQV